MTSISDVLEGSERWCVVHSEALAALREMPDCSVDSVVTDPPAGISFMGSDWDKDKGGAEQWVAWLTEVMGEVFRVLKPGGHAFVWALPRTSHWTGTALERAGFEIREVVTQLFGSGMPKSLNVSKGIDQKNGTTDQRVVLHTYTAGGNAGTPTAEKGGTYSVGCENSAPIELTVTSGGCEEAKRWDGFGTGLKPSAEFWWLARKPFKGTLVDNVLAHGCGCLNVDACRVSTDWTERPPSWHASGHSAKPEADKIAAPPGIGIQCHPAGRWPANLVLVHAEGCGERCMVGCPVRVLGTQSGESLSSGGKPAKVESRDAFMWGNSPGPTTGGLGDTGTASRYFPQFRPHPLDDVTPFLYQAKPSRREREIGCEHLPKVSRGKATKRKDGSAALACPRSGAGRSGGARNVHTTVKSVEFMRWLVRLVTPPGGLCLDPFCGSGTTGVACILEGFRFIGLEMNDNTDVESDDYAPYVTIARARISHAASWKPPVVTDKAREPKQRSLFG
jgi:site-specific DNA-methyltransferase (adenine-specific)